MKNFFQNIMGNQLLKNYDIAKDPICEGGPAGIWHIHRATLKEKNNMGGRTNCAMFILDKKALQQEMKGQKEEYLQLVRREASSLAKLKHPGILNIIDPLSEDQKQIAFSTEPIQSSLYSLIEDGTKSQLIPSETELKIWTNELLETLGFLHNTAKSIHLSLSPENIYISESGKLKIGGFIFSTQAFAESVNHNIHFGHNSLYPSCPNLNFTAPEIVMTETCSQSTDIFSLGCLLYTFFKLSQGESKRACFYFNLYDPYNKHQYEEKSKALGIATPLEHLPPTLRLLLKNMIRNNPPDRLSLLQIGDSDWLKDPLIRTVQYLEHLLEKEHHHKIQFLSGLAKVLPQFDSKIVVKRMVPVLMAALQNEQLSCHILPSLTQILERENILSKEEFQRKVWPHFSRMCRGKEMPAQSLFMIINSTETFLKVIPIHDFQSNMLFLYLRGLECGVAKLQHAVLQKIPIFAKRIEYVALKSQLLPLILRTMGKTTQLPIRMACLECINQFLSFLDRNTLKDIVLPSFDKLKRIEGDGIYCSLLLTVILAIAKMMPYDDLAYKIVPMLLSITITANMNREQFISYMKGIKNMIQKIEDSKLKEMQEMAINPTATAGGFDFGLEPIEEEKKAPLRDEEEPEFNFLEELQGNKSTKGAIEEENPLDFLGELGAGVGGRANMGNIGNIGNTGNTGNMGNMGRETRENMNMNMNMNINTDTARNRTYMNNKRSEHPNPNPMEGLEPMPEPTGPTTLESAPTKVKPANAQKSLVESAATHTSPLYWGGVPQQERSRGIPMGGDSATSKPMLLKPPNKPLGGPTNPTIPTNLLQGPNTNIDLLSGLDFGGSPPIDLLGMGDRKPIPIPINKGNFRPGDDPFADLVTPSQNYGGMGNPMGNMYTGNPTNNNNSNNKQAGFSGFQQPPTGGNNNMMGMSTSNVPMGPSNWTKFDAPPLDQAFPASNMGGFGGMSSNQNMNNPFGGAHNQNRVGNQHVGQSQHTTDLVNRELDDFFDDLMKK